MRVISMELKDGKSRKGTLRRKRKQGNYATQGAETGSDESDYVWNSLMENQSMEGKKMTVRGTMVLSEVCNSWCFCLES